MARTTQEAGATIAGAIPAVLEFVVERNDWRCSNRSFLSGSILLPMILGFSALPHFHDGHSERNGATDGICVVGGDGNLEEQR